MKKFYAIAVCLLAMAGCAKDPQGPVNPQGGNEPAVQTAAIRIVPVMTKVTDTAFENGDAIGLTVARDADVYKTNVKLTYNGLEFSANNLLWYAEGAVASTLTAYYPYSADGVPSAFTVAADQSNGTSSSDLVVAVKEGVLPTANAVTMPFKHKLSKLVVSITNNAGYTLDGLTLKGIVPTAILSADFTPGISADAQAADIVAYKVDETTFAAIVPPQTASITAEVNAAGKALSQQLAEATLAAGKKYTINVIVNEEDIEIALSGDVADWEVGGELLPYVPEPVQFEEHLDEGYFSYDNVRYNVVQLKDGKWWMAQNLRYVPAGITPCSDVNNVTGGVYFPVQINEAQNGVEFAQSEDVIAANGYLYQSECALGLSVGALTTVEAAEALEGAQGICPDGWHLPTIADITELVGKAVSPIATNTEAPYYNGSNGSIAKLNEDGFNIDAYGMVSIQDNTKTSGMLMGYNSKYPERLTSTMMLGSTYGGVTYNTSGDETSGVKNLQFWGLMPMTNKDSEADYTCNGTKVSYRIAGPVRCVRDSQ